jgi:hypothetical protein
MSKANKSISILDLARMESFGPIQIGKRLSEFALEVGPPVRWGDFSDPRRISCIMVFGDVEVGFVGRKNDAVVVWAKFWLHGFQRRYLDFASSNQGNKISIYNPFNSKFPTYLDVENELAKNQIKFKAGFTEPVGSDTTAAMNFGSHLKFYFTEQKNPKLTVIALS